MAGHTHYLQCWGDHLGSLDLLLYQFETAMEVETVKPFSRGFIFMSMFVSKCGNQSCIRIRHEMTRASKPPWPRKHHLICFRAIGCWR